jgi:hypothetical protein
MIGLSQTRIKLTSLLHSKASTVDLPGKGSELPSRPIEDLQMNDRQLAVTTTSIESMSAGRQVGNRASLKTPRP